MKPARSTPSRIHVAFLASAGLGLLLASGFALLASYLGLLFGGFVALSTVLVTAAFCAFVTPATALFLTRRGGNFSWCTLCVEVLCLVVVAIALLSLRSTREQLQIFMNPEPVPSEVKVHRGRSILHSSFVHFTAPPTAIASLIRTKQLVEVPAEMPDGTDLSGYSSRQQTKDSWDWWQPTSMPNPRFFFRHHKSQAIQGWAEGWWVSGETNEVYAFIGG